MLELLRLGFGRPIQLGDLPKLSVPDAAISVADRLEAGWDSVVAESPDGGASALALWRGCYRAFPSAVRLSGLYTALESVTFIAQPLLLGGFIKWLEKDGEISEGVVLGLGLVLASFLQALVHHLLYYETMKMGWNLRIAFTGLVHKKLLGLRGSFTQHTSSGKVTPRKQPTPPLIPFKA